MVFKLIFLFMMAAFAGVFILFQRKAGVRRNLKQELNSQAEHEVRLSLILRGVFGITWYATVFSWLLSAGWIARFAIELPAWLRWSGAGLAILAVALNWWGHQALSVALGESFDPGLRLRPGRALVVTGPYRWLRHPIYLAFLLMLTAAGLLSANWLVGFSGVAMILSVIAFRVPEEERRLAVAFGDDYRAYMGRTGRF
ncbi:MAG: isoprenylcysteine carboxylmethyltransferase family protein, partial [Chloroflexi bacterium]|nr:isoprenylcysteine carboxylmethyltransferase family protein [Chloroflexota bacterium]